MKRVSERSFTWLFLQYIEDMLRKYHIRPLFLRLLWSSSLSTWGLDFIKIWIALSLFFTSASSIFFLCPGSFISSGCFSNLKLPDPYKLPTLWFLNMQLMKMRLQTKSLALWPICNPSPLPQPTLLYSLPLSLPLLFFSSILTTGCSDALNIRAASCEYFVVLCL